MGRTTQLIAALLVCGFLSGSPGMRVFAQTTEVITGPASEESVVTIEPDTSIATTENIPVAEKCNEHGFICTAEGKYRLCIDNGPPSEALECKVGTSCHSSCPVECSRESCEKCNRASYYCYDDTSYQMCLDDHVKPENDVFRCVPGTTCSMNCNAMSICTQEKCPVTCDETKRMAVNGEPEWYYICNVDSFGTVTIDKYKCPDRTVFNVALEKCMVKTPPVTTPPPTTLPPTTIPPTTIPPPPACTSAGKFRDPYDCNKYYVCIRLDNGTSGYSRSHYTCPSQSFFNPANGRCTLDPKVCPNVKDRRVGTGGECPSDIERLEDPSSCSHYMLCHWFRGHLTPHSYECPDGSVFNPDTDRCTHNYDCNSEE